MNVQSLADGIDLVAIERRQAKLGGRGVDSRTARQSSTQLRDARVTGMKKVRRQLLEPKRLCGIDCERRNCAFRGRYHDQMSMEARVTSNTYSGQIGRLVAIANNLSVRIEEGNTTCQRGAS